MSTEKQIAANRENAKKPTGPRTPEGRNKIRTNALRHGITGQMLTLAPSDRPLFDQLHNELQTDFNPQNAMERRLVIGIAWDTWRLDRLRAIESNTFAIAGAERDLANAERDGQEAEQSDANPTDDIDQALADAQTFRDEPGHFELLSLYETRLTRNLHKNTTLLRNMQRERKRLYEEDKKEEVFLNRMNEIYSMPIQASKFPSKNGFVFSDEEIAIAVVRQRYVERARDEMHGMAASQLYGGRQWTSPDIHLMTIAEIDKHLEPARKKIHGVSPESIALRRLAHPEEFYYEAQLKPKTPKTGPVEAPQSSKRQ